MKTLTVKSVKNATRYVNVVAMSIYILGAEILKKEQALCEEEREDHACQHEGYEGRELGVDHHFPYLALLQPGNLLFAGHARQLEALDHVLVHQLKGEHVLGLELRDRHLLGQKPVERFLEHEEEDGREDCHRYEGEEHPGEKERVHEHVGEGEIRQEYEGVGKFRLGLALHDLPPEIEQNVECEEYPREYEHREHERQVEGHAN